MRTTLALSLLKVARRALPVSLRIRLRRWMFQWLDQTWRLPSGVGVRINSYSDWIVYNAIFVNGEYDPAIVKAIEIAPRSRPFHVLDLGANVGFFTLRFVNLFRHSQLNPGEFTLTLVEGNPHLIEELHTRVVVENCLSRHVKIVHGLVGERNGGAALHEPIAHSDGSIFAQNAWRTFSVGYVDVDRLLASHVEIDLLKCDIEGAEFLFIQNYPDLLKKTRVAVFEMHDHLCDTERCRRLLADACFSHEAVLSQNSTCSIYCVWR